MILICAWCKCFIKEKTPFEDKRESHGICNLCEESLRKEYKLLVPKPTAETK